MVISHNMLAMNANRMLNINTTAKSKSTEKLSSGYKVNRAADDAAGLAISEKMRRQIRGLTQASINCQDGISLVQVADGALAETHDILQRMNELAVKSANGTNTDTDRQYIQEEITHLKDEVDRIANSTTFNDNIYPLKGSGLTFDRLIIGDDGNIWELPNDIKIESFTIISENDFNYNGINIKKGDTITLSGITSTDSLNEGVIFNEIDLPKVYVKSNFLETYKFTNINKSDLHIDNNQRIYFNSNNGDTKYLYNAEVIRKDIPYHGYTLLSTPDDNMNEAWRNSIYMDVRDIYLKAIKTSISRDEYNQSINNSEVKLFIQAGSEAGQEIGISLVDATAKNLGVEDIDVSTSSGAQNAINTIKNALNKVSEFRSTFGAQQNRLEHTIKNLNNVVENTTAAESQIRDTDMATEMVKFSNHNVLEQAGQSILAQANQFNQAVLALL